MTPTLRRGTLFRTGTSSWSMSPSLWMGGLGTTRTDRATRTGRNPWNWTRWTRTTSRRTWWLLLVSKLAFYTSTTTQENLFDPETESEVIVTYLVCTSCVMFNLILN